MWWDQADDAAKPRVLLIGDSITDGYRPYVQELLGERACVDMLATSNGADNPALQREIDYVLGVYGFSYRVIHFNNGLHASHLDAAQYSAHLAEIVGDIRVKAPDAKLILALSTPVTQVGKPDLPDPVMSVKVAERNREAASLAARESLAVDDLYTLMQGKSDCRLDDGYHYKEDGRKLQAGAVADAIGRLLGG